MVSAIQQYQPEIKITWIIGKIEYALLEHMPNVDFIVFDKKAGKAGRKHVEQILGDKVFDVLFVMQVALRANLLSRSIKAKARIGFDWERSKELHWLFTNQRIQKRKHAHVLEGFMGFAQMVGADINKTPEWRIPVSDTDKDWVNNQLSILDKPFAIISPAASKAERNWLPERYAAVIDFIVEHGLQVVLCGGPGPLDLQTSEDISRYTDNIALNLVGKTSLKQMLEVLAQASFVIAPDTGPAHMATTQNTPVIGLYAHSNPRRTGPYLSLEHCVSVYDTCIQQQKGKPWQALPWGMRAKGTDLMQLIEVDEVKQKIDALLKQS
ncbi:MAG: glycosyltransferase family 9 protein [Pseudomonadota bacterium]